MGDPGRVNIARRLIGLHFLVALCLLPCVGSYVRSFCCCFVATFVLFPPAEPIDQVFNAVNLGQIFVIAVIASAIWWQSDNVSDIAGAMFFISIQQAFNGLNTSMRVFPPERGLMIRERSTGSYRVGPYFLAKSTSDIGLYTVAPILYATAVYWCVGLRPEAGVFFKFLLLFMGQVRGGRGGQQGRGEVWGRGPGGLLFPCWRRGHS